MKYFSEKEAENFLEKEGFVIVKRAYVKNKKNLKHALTKVGFPFVLKVAGKKIIHKKEIDGIRLGVKTYSEALIEFSKLKKIKGAEGVMVQRKGEGKEFLLGVKKTREFGHVILFGAGGSLVEEKKDVVFRVSPLEKDEVKKMIKSTKAAVGLLKEDGKVIEKNILKLCELVEKYPKIYEMDINPLAVKSGEGFILDARIVFE